MLLGLFGDGRTTSRYGAIDLSQIVDCGSHVSQAAVQDICLSNEGLSFDVNGHVGTLHLWVPGTSVINQA